MGKSKDITGQQFGRLTAVRRLDKKKGGSYLWECRCSCGNRTEVSANVLLAGRTQSCGCARKEVLQKRSVSIRGQTFGMLTALEPQKERREGSVLWKCRCACGEECLVSYNQLVTGKTTSCGCKRRSHEPAPLHYIDGTCIEMLESRTVRSNNTSGYTGVVAMPDGRWRAQIVFRGKRHILGTYRDIEMAAEARRKGEERIFGEFLQSYYAEKGETGRMTG